MRRAQRGISLVEMLAATAILGLIVVGTTAVLISLTHHAGAQAGRPPSVGGRTDIALDSLEHDLQLARWLPPERGPLQAGPRLVIIDLGGDSLVTWRQEGQSLLRGVVDDRRRLRERVVADGLLAFDMELVGDRLVQVTLRRRDETLRRRQVLLRNLEDR